jgi:hypothetical protein
MTEQIDRRAVSFKQAEGLEPLPAQFASREVSPETRSQVWQYLHSLIERSREHRSYGDNTVGGRLGRVCRDWHISHEFKPVDEYNPSIRIQTKIIKDIIWGGNYADVFEYLTFFMRNIALDQVEKDLSRILEQTRCAYRIAENTVFPIASDEEAKAITSAISALSPSRFGGARAHLLEAARQVSAGQWAASVRESVHAVEAVARVLAPESNTLDEALKQLRKSDHVHPALAAGFGKLYGYSNDEQGIRHPMLEDGDAKVDEVDALYMIGACAAFVSYLVARTPAEVSR